MPRISAEQEIAHVVLQVAAEPGAERHAETHLAPPLDRRRQQVGECVAENGFRAAALQLELVRQRRHVLDELARSEEHTSELQSRQYLVCRLLLEKKK